MSQRKHNKFKSLNDLTQISIVSFVSQIFLFSIMLLMVLCAPYNLLNKIITRAEVCTSMGSLIIMIITLCGYSSAKKARPSQKVSTKSLILYIFGFLFFVGTQVLAIIRIVETLTFLLK